MRMAEVKKKVSELEDRSVDLIHLNNREKTTFKVNRASETCYSVSNNPT